MCRGGARVGERERRGWKEKRGREEDSHGDDVGKEEVAHSHVPAMVHRHKWHQHDLDALAVIAAEQNALAKTFNNFSPGVVWKHRHRPQWNYRKQV